LSIGNNIKKDVGGLRSNDEEKAVINKKLDELITLISKSRIDNNTAKLYQQKFDNAIARQGIQAEQVEAFQNLDNLSASREELLDEFSILLSSNQFDSRVVKKRGRVGEGMSRVVLFVISIIMITLGFGMIIMPAPPFFEMFTIFYFNSHDGITIMDLISLLIILFGIFFLIKAIIRNPARNQ
jgi:hypothetical protein